MSLLNIPVRDNANTIAPFFWRKKKWTKIFMFCSLILLECVLTYMLPQALHRSSDCWILLQTIYFLSVAISFLFGGKIKKLSTIVCPRELSHTHLAKLFVSRWVTVLSLCTKCVVAWLHKFGFDETSVLRVSKWQNHGQKMQIPFLIAYQSFSRMKEFCKVMYQTQPLGFYLAQKKGK